MADGGGVPPHLVVLLESGNHDDDATPLLPHHVPEVPHGVQHWPLGGDVGPGSPSVTLEHRERETWVFHPSAQVRSVQGTLGYFKVQQDFLSLNSQRCKDI